ncbi:MAG: hypothetical protein K2W85_04255 [Phycisphaerales bacterium]|nr:hypothetical protein [Phycisphaerales bacterium]
MTTPWPMFSVLAVGMMNAAVFAQSTAPAQPAAIPAPDPAKTITKTIQVVAARPAPPKIEDIKTADDLLLALEAADARFQTLQANLREIRLASELVGGDRQDVEGRVLFLTEKPGDASGKSRRMFQVDYLFITADKVRRAENRTFIFDGEWFVERQPDVKQIHKRQIVQPGRIVDPLAIGQGPFPIPIGQRREGILERFTAQLAKPDDFPDKDRAGGVPDYLKDSFQLKLTPKPGTDEAQQFKEVRIWYRRSDLLPQVARTFKPDESVFIYLLTSVKTNETLPPGAFDTSVPTGWAAQIDEYVTRAGPGADPAAQPAAPPAKAP